MASWQEETMMPLFTTEEEREGNPTPIHIWNRWQFQSKPHQSLLTLPPFFKLLLFGIFAIIIHTVSSFEYQINYWTHWSKYLFYNSLLKVKSSWLRLDGVLIYSDI